MKSRFWWPSSLGLKLLVALGALVLVWGVGRPTQKLLDSIYVGERAPYLQMITETSTIIRWQTREAERGTVWYGEAPDRLERQVTATRADDEHEIRLTGLLPHTRYYYAVGTEDRVHWGQEGEYWFYTAPPRGQSLPVRFWVAGDSGYAGPRQAAVRDAMLGWVEGHPRPGRPLIDFWLALGDIAYSSGKAQEYQQAFFEAYPRLLRNFGVWPMYGNHDARRWVYYDIFTLPEQGEAGGVPSGTESYYSFDYANIHFVVLDSEASNLDTDGAMLRWLERDLAANQQPWLIAAFHHPPYSKGGHNSDNPRDSWGRLRDMRTNALPLLEAAGVDLVLTGHSHVYERSHLLACHYGTSDTLDETMVLERVSSSYAKPSGQAGAAGTIYVVTGSSSKLDRSSLDHPAMKVAMSELGSLLVDVEGNRLQARFIDSQGQVRDEFEMVKGEVAAAPRICP